MKTYFLFKKGEMIAVVLSKTNVFKAETKHLLLDYDYLVEDPQDAEKQITDWRARN